MQCPNCSHAIPDTASFCPNCGREVALQSVLNEMKNELTQLNSVLLALAKQTENLKQRFSRLETLTVASGQEAPREAPRAPEPAIEKTAPVAANTDAVKRSGVDSAAPGSRSTPFFNAGRSASMRSGEFEMKLGQKWLLIAGIIVSVLALGWFLKYSFEKNWIGPAVRVLMSYGAGVAFLGVGEIFRKRNYSIFGLYLLGGGIAMLYFSTFAAFQIYALIGSSVAFMIMLLITALAGILSLLRDTKWLAVLGLIGGFLTPVILSTGEDHQIFLMTYILILNVCILAIAFFKQWRLLNYLGFALTWCLFAAWYVDYYEKAKFWQTLIYLNSYFLIYAFTPLVYHFLHAHRKRLHGIAFLIPNSFIAFTYAFIMIEDYFSLEAVSSVTLLYAIIFLGMARYLYKREPQQEGAFVLLLAKGMLFLILTVPILFSEHWITFFWAIEATVILWAALKLQNRWLAISGIGLLVLMLMKFFVDDYSHVFDFNLIQVAFHGGYSHRILERYLMSATVLLALFQISRNISRSGSTFWLAHSAWSAVFWALFTAVLFIVLNIEVAAFFFAYAAGARFAAISVLWTLFSIGLISIGFMVKNALLRKCAMILFAITMLKVFLIDMSNVSTPYRIVSFTVLGLMLIGASYIYHRFKYMILQPDSDEKSKRNSPEADAS
ncbi:DUF2339 domain-containing protein [candidate division KSB1 bacterium]|nr:DUF2339 domain-containing protein [candidate division KSB1 bacterium]